MPCKFSPKQAEGLYRKKTLSLCDWPIDKNFRSTPISPTHQMPNPSISSRQFEFPLQMSNNIPKLSQNAYDSLSSNIQNLKQTIESTKDTLNFDIEDFHLKFMELNKKIDSITSEYSDSLAASKNCQQRIKELSMENQALKSELSNNVAKIEVLTQNFQRMTAKFERFMEDTEKSYGNLEESTRENRENAKGMRKEYDYKVADLHSRIVGVENESGRNYQLMKNELRIAVDTELSRVERENAIKINGNRINGFGRMEQGGQVSLVFIAVALIFLVAALFVKERWFEVQVAIK